MVNVANSDIPSVIQRKKIKKIVDHEVKVETKKEEEVSEEEDLRCDNEVFNFNNRISLLKR